MIEIGLYKSESIISKMIRWQTRGHYSHASLIFDGNTAIEAWHKGGVQCGPIHSLHEKGTVIDVFTIDPFLMESAARKFAEEQVGKQYDFRMVARFLTRQGENRSTTGRWFCSELVFAAVKKGGLELFKNTEAWEVSPDMLKRSPYLSYNRAIVV